MRLHIVRHGEAMRQDGAERSLTPQGEIDARAAGKLLAGENVDAVLYSPRLRTRQTASLILEALGERRSAEEDSLLPPVPWQRVADVAEASGADRLVMVSHLPLVAELVGWFCSGDPADYPLPGFPSGGVVALDMDVVGRGMARLAWYAFPPEYSRRRAP